MLNEYCGALTNTFAELAFYGILKDDDAQCFSVAPELKSGFVVLIVAAILLTALNSFVTKATFQYFHDSDSGRWKYRRENKGVDEDTADRDLSQTREKINAVPVLFTDRFRWLLYREDEVMGEFLFDSDSYGSGAPGGDEGEDEISGPAEIMETQADPGDEI